MRDLIDEAYYLYDREAMRSEELHDYAFVVFPLAKGFEGFLKKYLNDVGLATKEIVNSRHFRIGSSLNPDLPIKFRTQSWLVEALDRFATRSSNPAHHKLSDQLWQAWLQGRNKLFHYFPDHTEFISLQVAWERMEMLKDAMVVALECRRDVLVAGEKIDK